ncbi:hypothetical protein CONLIGDRAFT_600734 [Coniochaeta ligniaria NRRL 30616]|uniref:Uncharacterized protein n=1 Tax=Coniochaeta ligniaria NRRL 30616 TaxID=1408157 RepID=A0A1J7J8X6_9PEZI|nr:hypothetical protein CONLIGDRAFT_600734 [Coniochaeta ligniaria NRRL 30616]
MPIFDAREVLPWIPGSNVSDTLIGGIHFNKTALDYWNYTLYSNGTLSNGSSCILTFAPYTPALVHPNGSFVNVTWCYHPVNAIGTRAGVGIGFAVAFGLTLIPLLVALNKHGSIYLPVEKRFFPIGRRWQWYWGLFVCAAAIISLLTNVDVDRYYLPELPIILNVFFWYLLQMGTMALVWEAVRHWGSWMERQFIDPNPFMLPQDDRRGQFEFWLPLVFYLFLWLNFFMIVPRSWTPIELQRYPEQTIEKAIPSTQDPRMKLGAFFFVVCFMIILVSLWHSIKHYCPHNRGIFNRGLGLIRFTPPRFMLILPLTAAMIAYQILITFDFDASLVKIHPNILAMYLGGYAPSLLILWVNSIWGFASPNEDRALQAQRRARGEEINRELGFSRKPAWWRPNEGNERMRDRIARNVREIGGGRATAKTFAERNAARAAQTPRSGMAPRMVIPVGQSVYGGKSDRRRTERVTNAAAALLFPGTSISVDRVAELMQDGPVTQPPPPYKDAAARGRDGERPGSMGRSNSTGTTNSVSGPPQQVKSMLEI